MKLQFDPDQKHQREAVDAVVALFEGQPGASQIAVTRDDALSSLSFTETSVANRRVIDDARWLANLRRVQASNGIDLSASLATLALDDGSPVGNFPNFTVEMETGTGKTYAYLRTVQELCKVYGFRKFVIVVPSVPIREGVLSSLKATREHFLTHYGHERMEFTVYDAGKLNHLRNFSLSDAIQILVLNIDSFAKDAIEVDDSTPKSKGRRKGKGNVINQVRESGVRPIEFIQRCNPIVILDEPQNLETDLRKQAIARLNPLCALRYSATHRATYNLIYSLDPVRAYELGLVKKIGVDSVLELKDANQAFVEIQGFQNGKRSVSAKLTIWANSAQGSAKKTVTVRPGDDLSSPKLSNNRNVYSNGFIINEIDSEEGFIAFANGIRVFQGRPHGALDEEILRLQIEATVRRHFEKARKLHPMGIKVLSVFFIDRVSHYRDYDAQGKAVHGKYADWFEAAYRKYQSRPDFFGVMQTDVKKVHDGYFAQDRRAVSPFAVLTGKSNAEAESSAFELIMRDKERLLGLGEPLAFIFSHSALREGWDNPNVFQICTLAESHSEIKKRQEIGRGLRLAVNQAGERVFDTAVNRLTVIANESYDEFARQLQDEMTAAGFIFKKEMVQNEREKVTIRLKEGFATDGQFLELWERIRIRTRYSISYETDELIKRAAVRIKANMPRIERPKVVITRAEITMNAQGVGSQQSGLQTMSTDVKYVMPDFVDQIQARTGLSKSTVARILVESQRLGDALNDPQSFINHVSDIINAAKRDLLVYGDGSDGSGVKYTKIEDACYEMRLFEDDDLMEVFEGNAREVVDQNKTIFSHIVIDSGSKPEHDFAEACEANQDVLFYIKLPRWFKIETPVGPYNPDWALIYENDKKLYFVAETKDTGGDGIRLDLLRPIEDLRIECGKRHFANFEQVRFKVVRNVADLIA